MKQTKWFRTLMKIWISMISVIAFFGGWIIFGHTGKPVSAQQQQANDPAQLAPLPTLAPLPPLNANGTLQALPQQQVQPSFQFAMPRLRTRGS